MTRIFAVALGILTAIGGFLDIGDLVTNALVGSRFGLSLAWVVVVGVIGICLFAEMSGRVAAVSGRATFDLIRERLGPRAALANLIASFLVTLLTLTAEIGGVALALELATSVRPPAVGARRAFAVWLVIWRVKFSLLENVFGLLGLSLIVFAVALLQLGPDWGSWRPGARTAVARHGGAADLLVLRDRVVRCRDDAVRGVLLLLRRGRGELDGQDLGTVPDQRVHRVPAGRVAVGGHRRVRGGGLAAAGNPGDSLSQVTLPVAGALGKLGLAFVIIGFVAATFGAALETVLSSGTRSPSSSAGSGASSSGRGGGPVPRDR